MVRAATERVELMPGHLKEGVIQGTWREAPQRPAAPLTTAVPLSKGRVLEKGDMKQLKGRFLMN